MAGSMVPYSNPGGNNGTGPKAPAPIAAGPTVPGSTLGVGSNPFMPGTPGSTMAGSGIFGAPQPIAAPSVPGGNPASSPGSLYDTSSNETKQLTDIYGKGTGKMLDYILRNMQGADSEIFKQFLASMQPFEASERAGLSSTLGSMGVGPNSSVNAIAQGNLTSQFNAEAAKEDSQLMTQQLQDTIGIVTGTEDASAKETASSGWDVFGKVAGAVGAVAGDVFGAAGAAGGFSSLFS